MKITKSFLIKRVLPVVLGGAIGYAYYYFIGCKSGSCAITSNPYISVIYGASIGVIYALPSTKKKKEENNEHEDN